MKTKKKIKRLQRRIREYEDQMGPAVSAFVERQIKGDWASLEDRISSTVDESITAWADEANGTFEESIREQILHQTPGVLRRLLEEEGDELGLVLREDCVVEVWSDHDLINYITAVVCSRIRVEGMANKLEDIHGEVE